MARTKGRKFRRSRKRRWSGNSVVETAVFTIKTGTEGKVTGNQLSNVPTHSIWKPLFVKLSVSREVRDSDPAVQLVWIDPNGKEVASSPVVLMTGNVHTVKLAYPRIGGWFSPIDLVKPGSILMIRCICTKSVTTQFEYGCVCTMKFAVKQEIVAGSCPTLNLYAHVSDPPDIEQYVMVQH